MMNKTNSVIYIGVTNNLIRRVYEHKHSHKNSFTSRYKVTKLVYYEVFDDISNAIFREKQLKSGNRRRKIELINGMNPTFRDLYDEIASSDSQ